MAIKETVKGHCGDSKCTYDVYTKEKIDKTLTGQILNDIDLSEVLTPGIYVLGDNVTDTKNDGTIGVPLKYVVLEVSSNRKIADDFDELSKTVYQRMYIGSDLYSREIQVNDNWTESFIVFDWNVNTYTKEETEELINGKTNQIKETINEKLIEVKTITGSYSRSSGGSAVITTKTVNYPAGFKKDNSILLAIGTKKTGNTNYPDYVYGSTSDTAADVLQAGSTRRIVKFKDNNIELGFSGAQASDALAVDYKLVIARIVALG